MSVAVKWPVVGLSTLALNTKGAIAGGPFGSDLVSRDYVSSGVPVIRGVNLPKHAKFSFDDVVFVTENKADSLHLNCARPGDLVFTQRGTLGQVGLVPKDSPYSRFLVSQSQMKMTVDPNRADPLYLYYYFRLSSTVTYIENHALQSGVPHINLGILKKLQVIKPPLNAQKKIAAILSAYDDLIENNRRRIALLENMAEEIYREWFVRMRFPGHEQAKFEKGVPEGWQRQNVSELGTYLNGYAFDPSEWFEVGLPIIKIKELNNGVTLDTPRNSGDNIPERYRIQNGDIIFSWSGSLLVKIWDQGGGLVNQHLFKVTPNSTVPRSFLYLSLKFSIPAFEALTTGATMQHIKRKELDFVKVLVPPTSLIRTFGEQAGNFLSHSLLLKSANEKLIHLRGVLLPRLISGRLDVENLDIQFPPSMLDAPTPQPSPGGRGSEAVAHA